MKSLSKLFLLALLLVQHADRDTAFQQSALQRMRRAYEAGEE